MHYEQATNDVYKLTYFFAQTAQPAINKNDFLLFTRPSLSRSSWSVNK